MFRQAKARAAERGQRLREFVTEALQEKLSRPAGGRDVDAPPWMAGFGRLKRLSRETGRIGRVIEREFEVIEPEDRR